MQRIRLAGPADAERVAAIYAPNVTGSAISFEDVPPSTAEMRHRIETYGAFAPWLVLEDERGVAGYAYASAHRERAAYRWAVDVSAYVDAAQHRRGVGRALYGALLRLLPLQGFCVAHAGITLPNAASVGLHEACGFARIGVFESVGWKRGAWHDVGYWRRQLRERPGDPGPLRPLAEVITTTAWRDALAG